MNKHTHKTVSAKDISMLEKEVVALHQKIDHTRNLYTSLEKQLQTVYKAYVNEIRPFHLRYLQIVREINQYKQRNITTAEDKVEKNETEVTDETSIQPKTIMQTKELVAKEELLEFLVWVIDEDSKKDRKLLAKMTALSEKQTTCLGDMLERIPCDILIKSIADDETDISARHSRLKSWHEALKKQLSAIETKLLDLQRNDKFNLLKQFEQGVSAWKLFIKHETDEYQKRIQSVEDELKRMTDRTNDH